MATKADQWIVVTGATGRQGGAVARALLKDGWQVRALTRKPNSPAARTLTALGAEVLQGDMAQRPSLEAAFVGAYGLYSVQNPMLSGLEGEVQQGRLVAELAQQAGVQHLVYGSAGVGYPTGIGSWDSKLQVEAYMKALGIPFTTLRPMAFMELMTDTGYYPPVSTWYLMPRLMGEKRPVVWISVEDLGTIAAKVFASPEQFIGQELKLASDVKSIEECRALYQQCMGRRPARFPMPAWVFKRFVGDDLLTMWQWLRDASFEMDTQTALALHPAALTVEKWLAKQQALHSH